MSIFDKNNVSSSISVSDNSSFDIVYLESILVFEDKFWEIKNQLIESTYLGVIDKNPEILIEGFKDFVQSVKALITRLIEYIKTALTKFFTYISSSFKDFKKVIEANKHKVLSKDISFEYFGFNFTIDENVPNIKPISNLIDDYNNMVSDIKSKRIHDIKEEELDFYSKLPSIRADILDFGRPIEDYEFNDICVKRFRGGFSEPKALKIDNEYISNLIKEYEKLEKMLPATKKSYEQVVTQLNNLKSFFEKRVLRVYDEKSMKLKIQPLSNTTFSPENGDYADYDTDIYETLNAFMDLSFNQVKIIGSMINTTFYEKINAINHNMKQYSEIFKQALYS